MFGAILYIESTVMLANKGIGFNDASSHVRYINVVEARLPRRNVHRALLLGARLTAQDDVRCFRVTYKVELSAN